MRTQLRAFTSKTTGITAMLCLSALAGLRAQTPGGVTGASLWLKADAGTSSSANNASLTSWANQGSVTATVTNSGSPVFHTGNTSNGINYNPVVTTATGNFFNTNNNFGITGSAAFTAFVISKYSSLPTAASYFLGSTGSGVNFNFGLSGQNLGGAALNSAAYFTANATNDFGAALHAVNVPFMSGITYGSANNFQMYDNGIVDGPSQSLASFTNNFGGVNLVIGNRTGSPYEYNGDIAEVILFNNASLTAANLRRVHSYMAIKYGITLGVGVAAYVTSAGTPMYAIDAVYKNQIIGIARDNTSGLLQKQSHTTDDSLRIFTGTLAATNLTNTGTITNNPSSIIMGHNNGQLRGDSAATKPAGIYTRFAREWKVTNFNFSDDFAIEIKWDSIGTFNLSDLRLLVSSSSDFSAATVVAAPTVTFSLGSIIVSGISNSVIPMNSTAFITIGSVSASTPLPLNLLQFTAAKNEDRTASLDWQTAEEQISTYFEPQRSSDLKTWTALGKVPAAGNSTTQQHYQFLDSKPANGLNYYRIKLADKDGKSSYSDVRTVRFSNDGKITVSPNPVIDKVYITGAGNDIREIQLTNAAGEAVWQSSIFKNGDAVDMSIYASGIYILKMTNSQGETETFKLMKK